MNVFFNLSDNDSLRTVNVPLEGERTSMFRGDRGGDLSLSLWVHDVCVFRDM